MSQIHKSHVLIWREIAIGWGVKEVSGCKDCKATGVELQKPCPTAEKGPAPRAVWSVDPLPQFGARR